MVTPRQRYTVVGTGANASAASGRPVDVADLINPDLLRED